MSRLGEDEVSESVAWDDQEHAVVFDYLSRMPSYFVKKFYESFNECRILNKFQGDIKGRKFFEVGCATGELYRYITNNMNQFQYHGFDISKPGINRAKSKYPKGNFHQLTSGFEEIKQKFGNPDVVWCRDVVLHQMDPYEFLSNLIDLSKEVIVLRLRTRDVGETVMDVDASCQLHWDKFWVPYIVLNIDEMIEKISQAKNIKRIIISRNYEVLGGHNFRFLPKELFFKSSGTAETAVYIQKTEKTSDSVEVSYMEDFTAERKPGLPYRITAKILRMLG
jgi:2-polyprenyl-3-methyl-5-hydroxy-6-metoxy-1,4-benzoquinol methylase